jgi:hypothetical protein
MERILKLAHTGERANIGYTLLDAKNYLQARRQWNMVYGEIGSLNASEFFQTQLLDNPSFYQAYQHIAPIVLINHFQDSTIIGVHPYLGPPSYTMKQLSHSNGYLKPFLKYTAAYNYYFFVCLMR